MSVTPEVSSPPNKIERRVESHKRQKPKKVELGVIALFILVAGLLLFFTGQTIRYLPNMMQSTPTPRITTVQNVVAGTTATVSIPDILQVPGQTNESPLQVSDGQYIIYEQDNNIYLTSISDQQPHVLDTPGYVYNRSVSPIMLAGGQLLYSGDGLWVTNILGGTPHQVAQLPQGQVITSLAVSSDGSTVAWSSEPLSGSGMATIYAGPLEQSVVVYQHSALDCPCMRVFSFLHGKGKQGDTTILLADDRNDHHAVQYGLWSLDLSKTPLQEPYQLLSSIQPAGPLVLALNSNMLLYSSNEGFVPDPTDGSVPDDAKSLTYANSLDIAMLSASPSALSAPQVVLAEQHELSNSAAYRWVTTPRFTPDGHTLVYAEFSSDSEAPYSRHTAIYTVQISGSGGQLHYEAPQVLATTTAHFIELGVWLNSHVITFYADENLYALDVQTGVDTLLVNTGTYTHIVAVGS